MQLIAEKRTTLGKRVYNLRSDRKLPAVVFGKGLDSTPVVVDLMTFLKVYRQAGETELVDLKIGDSTEKVLIKQAQVDPVTMQIVHVSFHQVNLKEKIQAEIPVEIIGDDVNELVKSKDALPLVLLTEIKVEALPADLPNKFTVDISGLAEIGDGITVSQLVYDKEKIELVDYEDDELIVKLDYAVQEESEETEAVDEAELIEKLEATEETAKEDDAESEDK
jgi:large subunit ribosomal protein L25